MCQRNMAYGCNIATPCFEKPRNSIIDPKGGLPGDTKNARMPGFHFFGLHIAQGIQNYSIATRKCVIINHSIIYTISK